MERTPRKARPPAGRRTPARCLGAASVTLAAIAAVIAIAIGDRASATGSTGSRRPASDAGAQHRPALPRARDRLDPDLRARRERGPVLRLAVPHAPGEELKDGPPIHGNTRLEVFWTAIPTVLLLGLVGYSFVVLHENEKKPAREIQIGVTGEQFAWTLPVPALGDRRQAGRISDQLFVPKGESPSSSTSAPRT